MAYVVRVDDRERVKLPKGLVRPGESVIVIPAGRRIVLIPVPPRPREASSSWLKTRFGRGELRRLAQARALEELGEKMARRGERAHRD